VADVDGRRRAIEHISNSGRGSRERGEAGAEAPDSPSVVSHDRPPRNSLHDGAGALLLLEYMMG
jgi:hypothetical protein